MVDIESGLRDGNRDIIVRFHKVAGPGIESRWWRDIPQPSRPTLGATQPPIQRVSVLFLGVKAAGEWR